MDPELLVLTNLVQGWIVAAFGRARERRPGAFAPGLALGRGGEAMARAAGWGIALPGRVTGAAVRSAGGATSRVTGQVIDGWVEIASVGARTVGRVFAVPGRSHDRADDTTTDQGGVERAHAAGASHTRAASG